MDGNNQNFGGEQDLNNVPNEGNMQQPQMDYNQQYQQQPQMDYNQQYQQQPQMDYNQQYQQQPQTDYNQQYQQPQMDYNQQYQQPQMDYNQQNPYSYAPAAGTAPKGPNKPKGKAGKVFGIVFALMVVAGLVVAGVMIIPGLLRSERETVDKAVKEAFSSSTYSKTLDDVLGLEEINKNADYSSLELTINSIMGIAELSDLGISYSGVRDKENKKLEGSFDMNYQGESFLGANVLADENKTYFEVPALVDGYFSFDNKDFQNSYNNSYAGQLVPMNGFEGDLDYFAEDSSATVNPLEEIWDNAEIKKGKKEKVDVDGKSVRCTAYTATISQEDLEEYLSNSMGSALGSMGGADSANEEIQSMITDDVVITYYIKGNDLVKISANTSVEVEGSAAEISFEMTMSGDKNPMDKFDGKFSMSVMGTPVDLTFNGETTKSGDVLTTDFNMSLGTSGMSVFDVVLKNTFDSKSLEFNGEATANASSMFEGYGIPEIKLSYNGGYKDVKKGEQYTLDVESLEILADGTSVASLSLTTTKGVGVKEVSAMPTAKYDINTMSEEDFTALMTDNQANIMKWYTDVSSLAPFTYLMNLMGSDGLGDLGDLEDFEDLGDLEDLEDLEDDDIGSDEMGEPILTTNAGNVEILGTLPGYELSYACEYFVTYYNDDYASIEYEAGEFASIDEAKQSVIDDYSYYSEDELKSLEEKLDEKTGINYIEVEIDFGSKYKQIVGIKEVSKGIFLMAKVQSGYENPELDVNEALSALEEKYYKVAK